MDQTLHVVYIGDTELGCDWARVAAAVNDLRAQGRCDLLLHAGDVPLGPLMSWPVVSVMNELAFDAIALGNHDFDEGPEACFDQLRALGATALCANADGFPHGLVVPFQRFRRGGLDVGVVGLTLPDLPASLGPRRTAGLRISSPFDTTAEVVEQLRPTVDVLVVLSHAGWDHDEAIGKQIEGVDIIVGGHWHALLTEPLRVGRSWMGLSGSHGTHVGWFAIDAHAGKLRVEGGVLETTDLDPDSRASALLVALPAGADEVLGRLVLQPSEGEESALANLVADLIRDYASADLALVDCRSVATSVPSDIRRADLDTLLLYGGDRVARAELTGAQILEVLEAAAAWSEPDKVRGLFTPSGGELSYDLSRDKLDRVTGVRVGGTALEPGRTYTVALTETSAWGYGPFSMLRDRPHDVLAKTIRDVLASHLQSSGASAPVDGRLAVRR